jgi:outer membrane protein assembly factor BamB
MRIFPTLLILISCATVLITGCSPAIRTPQPSPTPNPTTPQLITVTSARWPTAAGNYVFWNDVREFTTAIYGYDLTAHTEFLVNGTESEKYELETDGTSLVWIELPPPDHPIRNPRLQIYDIASRTEQTLYTLSDRNSSAYLAPDNFVLDNGILYRVGSENADLGLYARTIATGEERLIAPNGGSPRVADGVIVWSEERFIDKYMPAEVTLYARKLDRGEPIKLVSARTGQGGCRYDVGGDYVAWACSYGASEDWRLFLHHISTGETRPIAGDAKPTPSEVVDSVAVSANQVVWSAIDLNLQRSTIYAYDLTSGTISTLVEESKEPKSVRLITNNNLLVYKLYLNRIYVQQLPT